VFDSTFEGDDFDVSCCDSDVRETLFCTHYFSIVDVYWLEPVVVYSLTLREVFPR
jgi:hypothetical protein